MIKINNKILIGIIAGLIIVGGVLVIGGQLLGKPKSETTKPAPVGQVEQSASEGKPISEPLDVINITNAGFEPKSATVKKDKIVIWINKTGSETGIKSDSFAPLNFRKFPDGSSVQLMFDKTGTYQYYNELNPDQTGTIVVE